MSHLPPAVLSLIGISLGALGASCATSSSNLPPLRATEQTIDLQRFMGDWYVIAHIPIDFFFASEANAYNAIENYKLRADGKIATTFTFRQGAFDGPAKKMEPVGWVHNKDTNAEWRMQFFWPFRSAYLIAHLSEDYQTTIIGVPNRDYAWIMARTPTLPDEQYNSLVQCLKDMGHDISKLRKVPQRW